MTKSNKTKKKHPSEEEPEEPTLQWEMGDILKSNYTGEHYIPYDIETRTRSEHSATWISQDGTSPPTTVQIVKLHNLETGQSHEIALTHVNGISFHNATSGGAALTKQEAISLALKKMSHNKLSAIAEPGTVLTYSEVLKAWVGTYK